MWTSWSTRKDSRSLRTAELHSAQAPANRAGLRHRFPTGKCHQILIYDFYSISNCDLCLTIQKTYRAYVALSSAKLLNLVQQPEIWKARHLRQRFDRCISSV